MPIVAFGAECTPGWIKRKQHSMVLAKCLHSHHLEREPWGSWTACWLTVYVPTPHPPHLFRRTSDWTCGTGRWAPTILETLASQTTQGREQKTHIWMFLRCLSSGYIGAHRSFRCNCVVVIIKEDISVQRRNFPPGRAATESVWGNVQATSTNQLNTINGSVSFLKSDKSILVKQPSCFS